MNNAYESGAQKIIPAVLLYAFFEGKLLMIHRNLNKNDFHEGKWNGLGGKLEAGESPINAAVREFYEESTCSTEPTQWRWLGQLYFPNFKSNKKEDWWASVFIIDLTNAQAHLISVDTRTNTEGTLHWIAFDQILNLNLWDGDREFIPLVLSRTAFEGTFFYRDGICTHHELKKIEFSKT
jgi:8-oxo-dGTP diphosphatase